MSVRKRTWKTNGATKTAWVVDYRDSQGARRLKTFATKKAADGFSGTAHYEVSRGIHTPDSVSITVREAGELWIKRAEVEGLEQSTRKQYRLHLDRHIAPLLGDTKLSRLTTPLVEGFKDTLLETRSRALSRKILGSLKALLYDAQRRGLVAQNVARPVSIKIAARDRRKVVPPTKAEVSLLLQKASGRWRPLIITAAFTGLRASELRALRWEDVDLDQRVLRVRQRADEWNNVGSLKSESAERDVPLTRMAGSALREWKEECPESDLDLVFPNGAGNFESLANIYSRGFAPLQRACGIVDKAAGKPDAEKPAKPKYGLHALRHFYASWLIDQGFAPKRVQQLLGHANISITLDRYGHLWPDDEGDLEKLDAAEMQLVHATRMQHDRGKLLKERAVAAD